MSFPTRPRTAFPLSPRELLLCLLAATLMLYAPSLNFQFVYDDGAQVVSNPRIQSWQHLPGYFTQHAWGHALGAGQANYYRPFFLLWLLLNHTLFGLNAVGYHLTTVLAHMAVVLLVYLLASQLLGDRQAALLAALVFAIHPVQVESVAWVAGVSEPLMALAILGCLLAYIRAQRAASGGLRYAWWAASLGLFLAALLLKESAAVVPSAVFVHGALFSEAETPAPGKRFQRAAWKTAPYLAVFALYLALREWALGGLLHAAMKMDPATLLLTLPSLAWLYVKHLVLPVGLALHYHTPPVGAVWSRGFLLPLCALSMVILLVVWWARGDRRVAFGGLWIATFLAMPLFTAGWFAHADLVHDRYLYVPMVGLSLLAAVGWQQLRARFASRPLHYAVPTALLAVGLAVLTLSYERHWSDNESLYRRSVEVSPAAFLPKILLAQELLMGKGTESKAETIALLRQAEADSGGDWLTQYFLGIWHMQENEPAGAEAYWLNCIRLDPTRGQAYESLGELRLREGRAAEAVAPLRTALEMRPDSVDLRLRYGRSLELAGDLEGALQEFRRVLRELPQEELLAERVARLEKAVRERHKESDTDGVVVPRGSL